MTGRRSTGELVVALVGLCLLLSALPARAQAPLRLVNQNTNVGEISFNFVDTQTLTPQQLKAQIALTEPGFFNAVRSVLPLLSSRPYPFSPVVLQKDVVRLRRYYHQQGFLHPEIGYSASQLDTTDNEIHVIFSIDEGPPVIIQDIGFFTPDSSYAVTQFTEGMREQWIRFRDQNTFQVGERYTDFKYIRVQSNVTTWLKNQGYAFAEVQGDSTIDRQSNTADIRYFVDAGPRGYISEINIEGNESVSDDVVRRELPFDVGDRFSSRALARGEQELFALDLFRLALIEVPEQPRDSTVAVEVRVQEADPRLVRAQTGYARTTGLILEGRWTHRNFLGGARNLTATTVWNSGFGAYASSKQFADPVNNRLRASLALRQPYLFVTRLSGVVAPFFVYENDALLRGWEAGVNTSLFYEILPFRLISLEHSFSRASVTNRNLTNRVREEDPLLERDLFSKSIFTLTATLGKTDDFLSPEEGFLVRPFAEFAGRFLGSSIEYYKLGGEASFYQPLPGGINAAFRLAGGRLFLLGSSKYNELDVFNEAGIIVENGVQEMRFDRIRFYAGGGSDVRGWAPRMLGPKVAQADTVFQDDEDGNPEPRRNENGEIVFDDFRYERLGGLAKMAGNLEFRFPFPMLGPAWNIASFLDFGQVSEGNLHPKNFRFGTGAGLRYETSFGHIRLDLAYKLNPTTEDLISPEEAFLWKTGRIEEPDPSFWQRFRIHLNIGQAF